MRASGTTSFGFILASLAIPIVAAILGIFYFRFWAKLSWPETFKDAVLPTLLVLLAVVIVESLAYSWQIVRAVYDDHESLVKGREVIETRNASLAAELEERKNHIFASDPVFSNINSLLMAFDLYRHARHGEPCVIWSSVPPESTARISSEVAQFSNSVSDCFTFGPFPGGGNPDYDKEALDGMVPDTVIFHAEKNDKAAFQLFGNLSSLMKMRLSYELPPRIRSHYRLPTGIAGKERIIWLQFGVDVKWNSQRR